MTVIKLLSVDFTPRHLPDTLRHHPGTARHPQTPSRHPSDTPIFGLHEATGRKSNIWISWYLFTSFQFIWYMSNPHICQTYSHIFQACSHFFQTLPDTLSHHPETPQTPPILVYMRPLGERAISEYHDIYSTFFNLSYIWKTPDICQTCSDTIQTLPDTP